MHTDQFTDVRPTLARSLTRRRGLGLLGAAAGAALWRTGNAGAKKKKKHPKRCFKVGYGFCVDGETVMVDSCGRKRLLKRGEQPGSCPVTCVPQCVDCTGGADGCGGTCGCPPGQVCQDATCQAML